MPQVEHLPCRVEPHLSRRLGFPDYLVISPGADALPRLRCALKSPAPAKVSLVVRILSKSGIPLAHASVDLRPGDCAFDTPIALLAMEGYTHLSRRARHDVECRIWSRRAFAIASAA